MACLPAKYRDTLAVVRAPVGILRQNHSDGDRDEEAAWPGECQVAAGLAFSHRSGQPGGQSHPMWPGFRCAGILALSHLRRVTEHRVWRLGVEFGAVAGDACRLRLARTRQRRADVRDRSKPGYLARRASPYTHLLPSR